MEMCGFHLPNRQPRRPTRRHTRDTYPYTSGTDQIQRQMCGTTASEGRTLSPTKHRVSTVTHRHCTRRESVYTVRSQHADTARLLARPTADIRAKVNDGLPKESAFLQRIAATTNYDTSSSYMKYIVQTRKNSNLKFPYTNFDN
jgi:hypothetical protein